MKIITRGVIDWTTLKVEEEDSYDYEGSVSECKSSGSAPQPVDPYEQAGAQYQLDTGAALFNAGLNRTNTSNPLGSSTWSTSYPSSAPTGSDGVPAGIPYTGSIPGYFGGGSSSPYPTYGLGGAGGGGGVTPPTYTLNTNLAPQFASALQQPINTSQIPGMPGGPDLSSTVGAAENANFNQNMQFIQPEQQLASEQLNSQLAAEGITPGSAAWGNEQDRLSREQALQTNNVAEGAVSSGINQTLPMLYGLGSESLQNQISAREAPINEFNALNGAPGATANAQTPDISGAFNQQYQGALAGYNANTATNNANTDAGASLLAAYLLAFA